MRRLIRSVRGPAAFLLGVFLLAGSALAAGAKPAVRKPSPGSLFVQKATWTESMLATRDAMAAAKNFSPQTIEATWKDVAAAFPRLANGFVKDCHRNHLAWFRNVRNVSHETWLVGRILDQLGDVGAPIARQLTALQKEKVPPSDPRWLNLYLRGNRCRDCCGSLNSLWIVEIRRPFAQRAAELLAVDISPEDPRWNEFAARVARISKELGFGRPLEVATLRDSLARLSAALPNHFGDAAGLTAAFDQSQRHWQAALPAIMKGDTKGLPELLQETQAARRAILMGVSGMRECLAVPAHAQLADEWEREYAALQHDLGRRSHFAKVAAETFRQASLVLEADRDPADIVLRRSAALLADLKGVAAARLIAAEQALARLQTANAAIASAETEARYVLFVEACRVRRQIALANPLLNFDKLVFLKRHRAIYNHMCDQYYGIAAAAGGGLYVLSDVFGPNPQLRDVLKDSIVERGRLQGKKLSGGPTTPAAARYDGMGRRTAEDQGGSFLSPDLSYDARQLAFAYVECQGDGEHRTHTDPTRGHWHEGRCYHVFKVNLDGTRLEQLTDGTWNDFDPCFMPSGRIAFTSERRGGYLRCGRVCPTFTIYDMAADGRDVRCLSYHETNEWHPSVGRDGMLLYTRWDYVDRHSMVAHHPWIITPDGRDPRALRGNYTSRQTRPDMELDLRAIPNSHKLIATAAPHHGQSFGSLVLLDPRVQDDDQMAAVKRITPEIGFPESQRGTETYGEAWPLSEDYYLCVYDAAMEVPGLGPKGDYGIYLVDSFGNRELIYRDPLIGSHNPIPLVPRTKPPVVAEQAQRVAAERPADATVGVVNVYHSAKPWPQATRIKALRVYQVLPLSVASVATAHNTGLQIPATSSINIARAVLGTVPVEEDGSAYFHAPACRELFFQALDEEGLAITTMRSATQFQPGEQLTCQGCHEPRHGAPPTPKEHPLAMRRAPSPIMPDVDGSNPFSYPRLVQPVLDKHCVACHKEKASDKVLPLDSSLVSVASRGFMDRPTTYYISYMSLAPKFGFYNYENRLETMPGQVGARVAPLYQLLRKGHYDVRLSSEEMHRIVLWLDSCSPFYGVYEKEGGEAQLRGEIVRPTLE